MTFLAVVESTMSSISALYKSSSSSSSSSPGARIGEHHGLGQTRYKRRKAKGETGATLAADSDAQAGKSFAHPPSSIHSSTVICGGGGGGGGSFSLTCEDFWENSFPACAFFFFFLEVEISSRTLISLFRPGSDHSGSAS